MRTVHILLLVVHSFGLTTEIQAQSKRDYQWIMGYDTSLLVPGGDAILLDFGQSPVDISNINTVHNFHMEGSNTSMSDKDGNLLFYSNGCYILNADNEIMENGDTINPGLIQDIWCPAGGSPLPQGVISIPAPGSDSLYYVFNLDMDLPYFGVDTFTGVAPQRLFFQLIDMTQASGLGKVVLKNQIAVQDTFARSNIQAVKHANGVDWWVIVPKSHSNCYFLTLVTPQGVQPAFLECGGNVWNDSDSQGQAVFSPDGTRYIRFNPWNGLNIFDFDNGTGKLSNPISLEFENDTFYHVAGVAVSPNSRYLYASGLWRVYQYDLQAADIDASKVLVAEWDGYDDPYPTIFYLAALAPDGKIYIASTSSHKSLHVIHKPDCPGLKCELEQRGVSLPSYNFATIPNFPQYRNQPANIDCDSVFVLTEEPGNIPSFKFYPNPTTGLITIESSSVLKDARIELYDILGRRRLVARLNQNRKVMELVDLENGIYFLKILSGRSTVVKRKIIKIK